MDDAVMNGDRVSLHKPDFPGRLNSNFYTRLSEIFEL